MSSLSSLQKGCKYLDDPFDRECLSGLIGKIITNYEGYKLAVKELLGKVLCDIEKFPVCKNLTNKGNHHE